MLRDRLKSIFLEIAVCGYFVTVGMMIAYAADKSAWDAYIASAGLYAFAAFIVKISRQPFTAGDKMLQNDYQKQLFGWRTLHDAVETLSVFAFFIAPVIITVYFVKYFGAIWAIK